MGTLPPVPSIGAFHCIYDPSAGAAERWYINDHTIFRDRGGTWHLIGITHPEPAAPFDELNLAHATAPALHGPWTKQPYALTTDPTAGETHLWAPHVIEHDNRYWMFYCAGGASPDRYRLHLATSNDAWTWTRHPANPLIVDGYEARDPMVVRCGDGFRMYYTATLEPEGGRHIVAAAQSHDLITWQGRDVVYADPMAGKGAGPTESPFVFERAGWFFLSIGPDWATMVDRHERTGRWDRAAYRRSALLASRDPLSFERDAIVATIDAHAAEFVTDESGQQWVSHCGWGQQGVWLAPIEWQPTD
jgi:beta-xylosidase